MFLCVRPYCYIKRMVARKGQNRVCQSNKKTSEKLNDINKQKTKGSNNWVGEYKYFSGLSGSENREIKCSNICVGRGESQTYAVNQSLSRGETSALKKWNVDGVAILGSCGFHQRPQ